MHRELNGSAVRWAVGASLLMAIMGAFCAPVARGQDYAWGPLGSGFDYGEVWALTVGPDSELIAGGSFRVAGGVTCPYIARWNGSAWQPLGSGMNAGAGALTVYNDDLIAGGNFTTAGGVTCNGIARWNGSAWQPLGSGMSGDYCGVGGLTVYNNQLIAGGNFSTAGGVTCPYIARWNGSAWQPLGSGMDTSVGALTVYNNQLIAGGNFTTAGGVTCNGIARWNGSAWQALGSGMDGVSVLTVYNNELIAGGCFSTAGGVTCNRIARWDGSAWQPLGTGMSGGYTPCVWALTVHNGDLIAGGRFTTAGGVTCNNIARWNGSAWQPLGTGMSEGSDPKVYALTVHNGDLIAGGRFTTAGGVTCNRVARWTICGNTVPVANAGGPYSGVVGQPITFNASGSYDPDGTIVGYRWDWTNDGTWDTGWLTTPTATHTYTTEFSGQVKLEVKDEDDGVGGDVASLDVLPGEPTGACCLDHFLGCWETTQASCSSVGGTWRGAGTVCDPNPCYGACCTENGNCHLAVDEASCSPGSWQGLGTDCYSNPSCAHSGACCFCNGQCLITTPDLCDYYDRVYLGDGTICGMPPCSIPPPTAHIVGMSPFPAKFGEEVTFTGHAEEPNGHAMAEYKWESSKDGLLGSTAGPTFQFAGLSPGRHRIRLRVKDQCGGAWSPWSAQATIEVVDCDHLVRPPYTHDPWTFPTYKYGSCDSARITSDLASGAVAFHVENEGAGTNCRVEALLGKQVDLGGTQQQPKQVTITIRFSTSGGKAGETYSDLWAYGDGDVYKFVIDNYWSVDVILSIFADALEWVFAFWPGSPAAINLLIDFLQQQLILEIVDGIADAMSAFEWTQAMEQMRQAGYAESRVLVTPVTEPCWGTHFIGARLEAGETYPPEEALLTRWGQIDYIAVREVDSYNLIIQNLCQTDVTIVDPVGRTIGPEASDIVGARYSRVDVNGDGEEDSVVFVPAPVAGVYDVHVIPRDGADPGSTYSVIAYRGTEQVILAMDVPISDIPTEPYTVAVESENAPFVECIFPANYENLQGVVSVQWAAWDAEGSDALTLGIDYTSDGGVTWSALGTGVANTGTFLWNTLSIPDGIYGLRFLAADADGHVGAAMSSECEVKNHQEAPLNEAPDSPASPAGRTSAFRGLPYRYSATTTDPEADLIYYRFDWGDGQQSDWLGSFASGVTCRATHVWQAAGTYEVRVTARDERGWMSDRSAPLVVTIRDPNDQPKVPAEAIPVEQGSAGSVEGHVSKAQSTQQGP